MREAPFRSVSALLLAGTLLSSTLLCSRAAGAEFDVFFGTHNTGPGHGFSVARFDSDTGNLTVPRFVQQADSPAFFVLSTDGRHLYSVNSGNNDGLSAYAVDAATGNLTFLNRVDTGGGDPSYVSLDKTGRFALVANYSGGSVAVFAVQPDGSLGNRTAFIQHTGHSVNPQRQTHAYAHSIITDPSNRYAIVCDLGLDKVFVYRFDAQTGTLTPNDPPFAAAHPGSGPRHPAFSPDGKYLYVIHEMGSIITQFAWDGNAGTLKELATVSTLPPDFKGTSTCAEIQILANGKFLYASNRGHDSIAVFAIAPADGSLTPIQWIPSGGKTPRNFAFDPTGQWLLATNHGSNNAVVFRIDQTTGKLTQQGDPVPIVYPFCERFLAVPPGPVPGATAAGAKP